MSTIFVSELFIVPVPSVFSFEDLIFCLEFPLLFNALGFIFSDLVIQIYEVLLITNKLLLPLFQESRILSGNGRIGRELHTSLSEDFLILSKDCRYRWISELPFPLLDLLLGLCGLNTELLNSLISYLELV